MDQDTIMIAGYIYALRVQNAQDRERPIIARKAIEDARVFEDVLRGILADEEAERRDAEW